MKYASKKRRPLTSTANGKKNDEKQLELGDKNVFKDARVRLILIKNRRQDELEHKMRIAEMNKTQTNNKLDAQSKRQSPFRNQETDKVDSPQPQINI